MKTLVTLALLMLIGTAIVGCKASAEVGDAQSQIAMPR
jgi:hypothetical protein